MSIITATGYISLPFLLRHKVGYDLKRGRVLLALGDHNSLCLQFRLCLVIEASLAIALKVQFNLIYRHLCGRKILCLFHVDVVGSRVRRFSQV